jgi:fermentation-respiration switch protein FrsA (DUF1100 family)
MYDSSHIVTTWAALLVLVLCQVGCEHKKDKLLFSSESASLDDYDFTDDDLDGIDPARITSELIPSGSTEKKIHVIYVKGDQSKLDTRLSDKGGISVLFSHGTGGNMLWYWYRVGYFESMGFNVLMYDYRGYGASEGKTTEENIYEDATAAYDYLAGQPGVGPIIAAGFSLGGSPTIWLCSDERSFDISACYTESSFSSADEFLQDLPKYKDNWYLDAQLPNAQMLEDVTLPFMMFHGTEDQLVLPENAHRLWASVKGNNPLNRFYLVEGAAHANVPIPSYSNDDDPAEYSHPTELPSNLLEEFEQGYKTKVTDFIVEALNAEAR